jgi:ribosomal protein S12 methylthiotransferase
MRRPERRDTIRARVQDIRRRVPDVAIRTTCIVGFPGETDADFETLLNFLEEMQFERVGGFTYSPQEGTRAASMADDVPEAVKRERLERLTELQRLITAERYDRRVGRVARAIVDVVQPDGVAEGRAFWQADDVDGITRITCDGEVPPAGSLVDIAIERVADDYDFEASLVREVSSPVSARPARARALPVIGASLGSYGR